MLKAKISDTKQTEALLAQLPLAMRTKSLPKAIRKAGNEVAKAARANLRRVSRPGYEGDDPDKKPLAKTVRVKVKHYGSGAVLGMVGTTWPEGAHAHLVEFGFQQKYVRLPGGVKIRRKQERRVRAQPWLRPAADTTKPQQQQAIVQTLKSEVNQIA